MKNKMDIFNKYLYVFIFSVISTLVFIVDFAPVDRAFLVDGNVIYRFLTEIYISIDNYNGISEVYAPA